MLSSLQPLTLHLQVLRDMAYRGFLESALYIHNKTQPKQSEPTTAAIRKRVERHIPGPPSWSMFKNSAYFERTLEGQQRGLQSLRAILEVPT
jgi:hypothetical protein